MTAHWPSRRRSPGRPGRRERAKPCVTTAHRRECSVERSARRVHLGSGERLGQVRVGHAAEAYLLLRTIHFVELGTIDAPGLDLPNVVPAAPRSAGMRRNLGCLVQPALDRPVGHPKEQALHRSLHPFPFGDVSAQGPTHWQDDFVLELATVLGGVCSRPSGVPIDMEQDEAAVGCEQVGDDGPDEKSPGLIVMRAGALPKVGVGHRPDLRILDWSKEVLR